MNGWTQKGLVGLVGAAVGASGILLTVSRMHDVGIGTMANQEVRIQELLEFKARIDRNVEEWRGDQSAYRIRMERLESESARATRERTAMFRWMERVSAKLNVEAPVMPQVDPVNKTRAGVEASTLPQ